MNNERRQSIEDTVEHLKHLDEKSLLIIKSGAELLRSRDALDNEAERDKKAG